MKTCLLIFAIFFVACTTGSKPGEKISVAEAAILAKCRDCPADQHMSIVMAHGTTARLFIRGFVNDQPKKFLVDTGAVRSSLISDDDTKNLKSTGRSRMGGVSLTPQTCDWVKIDSFKILGWHFAQAPFSRCEDRGGGNVLGLDYMKHALMLDFEHARISLKGPAPKEVKLKELKRNQFGMPEIPVKIAGKEQWALFDTGCGMTVVDQAVIDANPKAFQPYEASVDGEQRQVESPFKDSAGKLVSGQNLRCDRN